ncbi:MAG TPA: DUF4920 domain-containing protein [Bacteroidetes bacterium]|nr:DUF4920 domain-containing protein [Bacteroidota bacterium]
MKNLFLIVSLFISVIACTEGKKESQKTQSEPVAYLSYGEKITDENSISKESMAKKFENLKEGDTIEVKFASSINEVCKAKGCWMKLDLGDEKESMVKFTDYGFFMPLNSDNKEVIVEGRAFISEVSVDELKHLAKDAGKTEEEIASITKSELSYGFEADGVLMKE